MQFDYLVQHGANPRQLFFSHAEAGFGWQGRTREQMADYFLGLAREGGRMLFNNFGYDFHTPWEDLVYLIRFLCDHWHASTVLISIDAYWSWKNDRIIIPLEEMFPHTRHRTYAYMMTDVVPALLKAGFSAKQINTFLVANPRAYFSERRPSA